MAKINGSSSWITFLTFSKDVVKINNLENEAMQEYAKQMCEQQRILCNNAWSSNLDGFDSDAIMSAPLATDNI